jgi:hypothetical protein
MFAQLQHYYTVVDIDDVDEPVDGIINLRAPLRSPLAQRSIVPLPSRARGKAGSITLMSVEGVAISDKLHDFPARKRRSIGGHGNVHASPVDARPDLANKEVFQSITCTLGIQDKSFEELRLECYMQTLVATGLPPPPVQAGWLTIPPAFTPFVQHLAPEAQGVKVFTKDVVMSVEPRLFSFSEKQPLPLSPSVGSSDSSQPPEVFCH